MVLRWLPSGRRRSHLQSAPHTRSLAFRLAAALPAALALALQLATASPSLLQAQQPALISPSPQPASQVPASPGALRQQADHQFLARRGISWEARQADPAGPAPRNRIRIARAQQQRLLFHAVPASSSPASSNAAGSTWQSLGPVQIATAAYGSVTGRITSLAADPNDRTGNTLYLGATGGGIWKSTNAASASAGFVPLTDTLPAFSNTLGSLSIGALTVQPTSSGVILAGTGDPNGALDSYYGVGILRSTDGGSTWTLISGSSDGFNGGYANYAFTGSGFAGFAWSSVNPSLVVAAVGQSAEGMLVNSGSEEYTEAGLYYSSDAGQTWYLGTIEDSPTQILQSPHRATVGPGNPATSVLWNPIRQRFYAAVRFHGYYESTDGITWTRLANQPGPTLNPTTCPANPGGTGQTSCPIFRGALAVQPLTGDMFALTTDLNNQDQGLFQDHCSPKGLAVSNCSSNTVNFATQLSSTALEVGSGNATIPQADYNLTLAAVPSQQDTLLFAGTEDIYRCSLANSCNWRNTTNTQTCAAAQVAPSQHATESTFGGSGLLYFANDGGLWRSTDDVAQTGSVCAATDGSHYQNLNSGIGSLAEINHFAISPASPTTLLAGMGGFGTVATSSAQGPWQQVLTGEGAYTAIDPANAQTLYADAGAGVNIHRCTAGANCNAAGFGAAPVIGSTQVSGDADYFSEAAPWILDPLNSANLVVGTCRVWRGPATGGSGWSTSNVLSQILDGNQEPSCNGNAEVRSLAGGLDTSASAGTERMYAGMAGTYDGGGTAPGHIYTSAIAQNGGPTTWTDLYRSTVTNSSNQPQFNPGGFAISSIAVDPHDTTGQTVYVTMQGFSGNGISEGELYRSTDAGAHWVNITSSLPLAPANSVVVDPNVASIVYVALDTGVYYTQNVSACSDPTQNCWAVYGAGLPNAPVTELHVYTAGNNSQLIASTYGRGIWGLGLLTASAQATLTPSTYTFAGQQTQTTSAPVSFSLNNTGVTALSIGQVTTSGDYAQTNTCGLSLPASASCTIHVTFTPTAPGTRSGTLTVYANVSGGQLTSALSGTGLAPGSLTATPSSLTFPATGEGSTAAAQSVTVQNTGGVTVQLQQPTITTDYQLAANSCGTSLAPGATCTLQVTFTPSAVGDRSGSLSIPSNLASSPLIIPLDGNGTAPPALSLSPASLTFLATGIGSVSASQTVTVSSSGGSAVQLQTPTVSGDYQITNNGCGATLPPGTSCSIQIAFAPTATGSRAGLLTVAANVAGGQVTASLNGTGVTPAALAFTPASLSFPATTQGVTSSAQSLQLSNSGGATATLQPPSITGDYAVSGNNCGSSLAPGASCVLQVTFTPTAPGDRQGVLTVPASVTGGHVSATLDGTGVAPPALTLNPSSLTFGNTAQGTTSPAQGITVTNSGGATAQLQQPTASGDFAVSASTCGAMLAAGASCSLQVTFTPTALGSRTGVLTIPANVSGGTATAPLAGTGVAAAALTLSPTSLTFPSTAQGSTSPTQAITVTNTGGVSAQLQTPTITGDYQLISNSCGATLAPGATCTLQIAFAPTAAGTRTGVMTLPANVAGGNVSASLNGAGVAPAALTLSPPSLSFAATTRGTTSAAQSIQLTSSGGVNVQLGTPSVTGDYGITTNSCGGTLAPGAGCTLQITFNPTTTGDRPGQLTVPANVSTGQVTAALDGTGLAPAALSLAPTSLTFGATATGTTSPAQSITVANAGGSTAQLQPPTTAGDFAISSTTCGTTLAASASCSISVTFTPGATGSRTGVLTLQNNAPGGTLTAPLNGTGALPAAITFSPSPANFSPTVQGSASAAQAITVTSNGGVAAQLGTPSVTADYQVSGTSCGANLAVGASCVVQVVFHPVGTGDRPGTLAMSGNLPGGQATDSLDGTGLAPGALTLSPSSVNYGTQLVNTTSTSQQVTVTNVGGAPVLLQPASVTGQYQLTADSCGTTLAPNASCSVGIEFKPTTIGDQPGQLVIPATVSGNQVVAALDGNSVTPGSIAIAPATLNFGSVVEGTTSPAMQLTATNSGGLAVHLQSTTISGNYSISSTSCGATLAPGAACMLQVTFAPPALGSFAGTLTITSDAPNSPATVSLGGTGVMPASVALTPHALNFGAAVNGTVSAAQSLTATNSGGVAATLATPVLAGDYQLTGSTCGTSLAAGASCTLQVAFAPTVTGDRPGSVSLGGQFSGTPATATLDGAGVTPGRLTLSPSSLTFTALVVGSTSSPQAISVSNSGGANVNLQPATVSADYVLAANSCGAALAPGATCIIQVAFRPTASGDRPGQLVIPANVSGGQAVAALDGNGLNPASLSFSPATLDFGGVLENTSSAPLSTSLTNSGGILAHIQPAAITGDYAIASNTCGATLAPGASCSIQVIFTPTAPARRTGTLSLVSDAPASPATASLVGGGLTPANVTLTPSAITFQATVDGTTSSPQTVTATNTGGVNAAIRAPQVSAGYQITANTCTGSLAAGASCSLQVVFAPLMPVDQPGTLSLAGQFSSSPAVASLDGTGVAPGALMLTPSMLAFGAEVTGTASAPQSIVLSNPGGVAVQLGTPATTPGPVYSITGNTCGATLAPNASCTLQIVFSPATGGDQPGLLTVPGSIAGHQVTAALSGSGVAPGAISFTPPSLDFASTVIDTSSAPGSLTLSNSGGAPLTLQAPVFSADYQLAASNCPGSLPAGASCTLQIVFHPTALGNRPGMVTVSGGSGAGRQARASLTGDGLAPAQLGFNPSALTFGSVQEGKSSAPLSATLSNSGGVPAQLATPVLTGDYQITSNSCGSTLNTGASCAIRMTFSPTDIGDRRGSLVMRASDGSTTATLALDGTGTVPPSLAILPASVTFSATLLGTTTAAQNVVIGNIGTKTVRLMPPTITGDFQISADTCTGSPTLDPDYSCTLSVTFTPTAGGQRTGLLTISDGPETHTVPLSGTGLTPATDTLSTTALTFGPQVVGTVSPAQTVSLTNSGGATLNTMATEVTGDFIATNNCGSMLGGGLSCTIAVIYAPKQAGTATGQLIISDARQTQTITLSGQGVLPPRAIATPGSIDFGGFAIGAVSTPQSVTFTNNGATAITGFTATTGSLNFAVAGNACGNTIAPAVSCTIGVSFTPQTIGNQVGQLTLNSPSLSGPLTVALAGAGEDFELSTTGATSALVTNGQSATYSVVVTPVGSSAGSLVISCSGAPVNSACTASPSTVNVAANATGSVTVSIATGLKSAATSGRSTPPLPWHWWQDAAAAAGLLLPFFWLGAPARRTFLILLAAAALVFAPTACGVHASGGTGGTATKGVPPVGTTPPGKYTVTILGTFPGAQRSTSVTLVVE